MSKPQPDWQANLMERYKRKGHPRLGPLQVKVSLPFVRLMDAAAKKRGMTRSAFIRRSVAVQIGSALDRDVIGLLAECPSLKPYGFSGGGGLNNDGVDLGLGIEVFCPHPGCDGTHLT